MIEQQSGRGSAVLSDDERYRYRLTRHTGTLGAKGRIVWVMLNPSTADGLVDDPTVGRCRHYSTVCWFAELVVVNLFALRATEPDDLLTADDPVGPDNDRWIARSLAGADRLMLAWGAWPTAHWEFAHDRVARVVDLVEQAGHRPQCLALTANGQPRHPLYLPKRCTPIDWPMSWV